MKEQIRNYIHTHKSEAIAFASHLVQQSSVRGNEGETQAIVVEKCRQLGLEIDLWELDDMSDLKDNPNFHCDRKSFRGAPNLVAVLKGSGEGKSIILNGHIDVVPEGNRKDWTDDPFSGIVKDGKMYGRGTTDMKGGNVSLLMALEALVKNNVKLKGDVIFQSVIEEESGGAGTLAAVLRGYQADGAIIPEPTDLKFFPYQQGSLWFRLTIKGKSAHGGTRYEGTSSLDLAFDVIEKIKQLEKERNELLQEEPLYASIPIPIPINIGVCHSGNWPSSVPDVAILEGRYGVSPHETMENAMSMMEQKIKQLNATHEWFKEKPVELDWFGARWLPNKLELNHPLLQILTENYIIVENKLPKIEAAPWGTDGGILSSLAQTPTIVFGPGTTKKAHDSNEYIEIEKMVKAAEIIALTIIDWCEIEESHSQ